MMRRLLKMWRSERGASLVEFALIAPAFCTFIVAIGNLGILFFAHSGLTSAVAEGARYASIYPRPTNAQIIARINDRRYGMTTADITGPTVTACTSNGRSCLDIQMSYVVRMNFVFFRAFDWTTFTITERRRVFVYS
jgi:Flp pilus assembly protein TadG